METQGAHGSLKMYRRVVVARDKGMRDLRHFAVPHIESGSITRRHHPTPIMYMTLSDRSKDWENKRHLANFLMKYAQACKSLDLV
jgi:hypothetical protein